ncbi:zinc finger, CCHC-type containing protein [Tanacetum coccineum]
MLRESTNFSEESVEKSWGKESANESDSKFIPRFDSSFVEFVQPYSEEFINVFMRIGFGSTIKLVSFDESQVVTFDGKFICSFRNCDCETESQSGDTVGSPHGFIIYWIVISKNIKKVTKVIDVENWRIDNSRVLRWIVSLIVWNSSVSSTKSLIQKQIRKSAKWDNDDYDSLEDKYMAEDASSKKFLVSNFTNYEMTDSRSVLEQYNEHLGILGRFTQHKLNMDDAIQVSCIIDKLPPSWKNFKHTLKHLKEELTLVELENHLRIEEYLRVQDSNKPKGNNVVGPSVVNMVEHNNSSRYNDNKGKRKHHDNKRADPNKKAKSTCWKCGKTGHIKRDCKGVNVGNKANGLGTKGSVDGSFNSLKGQNMFNKSLQVYYVTYVSEAYFVHDDDVAWWVDSGATVHVYKDRCWFKTYESLNDGSILYIGNESIALVHGRGCVDLKFSSGKIILLNIINDNIASTFMSTFKLNDSILWHARLGHVYFKRMQDMSKDRLIPAFDMDTEKCKTCMLTKITKKPFQNVKRETKVLELIHSDLCDLHATPSLGNKKYFVTFIDDASRTELRVLG